MRKVLLILSMVVMASLFNTMAFAVEPQIAAGVYHSVAVKSDGTLWTWGNNGWGQLGDGTTTESLSPVQTGTDNQWTNIAAGGYNTFALKSDGTLWAWGWNNYGQLGDGTTTTKLSPIQIGIDNQWTNIAAGGNHTIALKSDGTLWAWGVNWYGQLGDIGADGKIGIDNQWANIAAGWGHTIALKSDGTLWAWGLNSSGQLGDGTLTNRIIPTQIGTDNQWTNIAAGYYHTIALKSDGTLWAWGRNYNGQLGDGTLTNRIIPTQIGTDNQWTNVAAGGYNTIALKSDGTLWAWGWNLLGQLGDCTTINKYSPVQIGTDNQWTNIAAGRHAHTMALKSDGTLWAWGWNEQGQLGDGTTTNSPCPVQIFQLFEQNTLIVTKAGTGSGTATSAPAGISCGDDCSENYYYGTEVILTATAANGSTFAGWSGDPDCSDGSVIMNANKTCTATFNLQTYTLTLNPTGTGSGTLTGTGGINCIWNGSSQSGICSVIFNAGTVVILSASANTDAIFKGWSNGTGSVTGCSDIGQCVFNITQDSSVTATLNLRPYGFIGPLSPYASPDERSYKVNSAIPIKWQYADSSGNVINSSAMNPMLSILPSPCSGGDEGTAIMLDDAGQSGYQYDSATNTWQFNWKTTNMQSGCFNIRVTNSQTSQINGPFPIKLVR